MITMNKYEYEEALYAFIERALAVSVLARREGLLALGSSLDNEKIASRDIFDYGMRFVVDGTDYTFIDKVLSNIIKQEKNELRQTLMTIQKEAVLAIQEGMNPKMIAHLLNSYTNIPLNDPVFKRIIEESK